MAIVYLHRQYKYGYAKEVKKIPYHGKVWCVETDSGFIVIKRDNKITVTGNCYSLALSVWGTKEYAMPEIEEDIDVFER